MLRNLIVISSSGIVLFSKEFLNSIAQPRLIGGLVTAMLDVSINRTGLPVAYIELSNVAIAVVSNIEAKVTCAVFLDRDDGCSFAKLITRELLYAFIQQFSTVLEKGVLSLADFSGFNAKITEVIRNSVRPVLDHLQQQRGIQMALLVSGDTIIHSTAEVDKVGVLANLQALLGLATDLMYLKNDVPLSITMHSRRSRLVIRKVERSILVVVCKTSANQKKCDEVISKAARLTQRILILVSNLQDVWHGR
eukprot:TRINITY_DN4890_c0_g5_i1.p1 TRINITY_DN4890_c0_g5~~TRINITY_DN4890_c0_g5_i1.p1  ORF type:complete len:250 (+),score=51.87 TRINITY_DN4890_c0_g5_i1:139-888(+)